jgi:hypothetical protein
MNQIKSGLTRLKNRVSEKISEEQDVLGFSGVTKAGIVSFIDRAYGLISRLEALRGTFAIVTLKRKIVPAVESCKNALDAAIADEPDKEKFDEFLNGLTKIHDDIYMTYVVYCSEGINIEADIGVLGAAVTDLSGQIAELRPTVEELAKSLDSIQEMNSKSEEILDAQEEIRDQSTALIAEIEKAKTSALASAEVLTKYENNAKNEQDTINSLARKAAKTDQHIKQVIAEVAGKTELMDAALAKANSAATENERQQQEITKTLEAASKYGMAASFKERKNELRLPMLLWSVVFVLAIAALFATGVVYIVPQIAAGETPKATDILIKLTLVSPLIWLGWVAAKQYGYIARIREDYSFKYASALAFEGYKKEALNVDPALLRDLLNVATNNMALNPLRIYSHDDNDASPFHDAFRRIFRTGRSGEKSAESPAAH